MQLQEFEHSMGRLQKFYGRKLDDAQLDMWFEKLGWREPRDLNAAIAACTSEERQFPTPSVLAKYISVAAMQNVSRHGVQRVVESCQYCQSTGFIHTVKAKSTHVFKCPRCRNCLANYPVWRDEFYRDGYRWENEYTGFDPEDNLQVAGLYTLKDAAPKLYRLALLKSPEMEESVSKYKPPVGKKNFNFSMNEALGLPEMNPAEKERKRQESLNQERQREKALG